MIPLDSKLTGKEEAFEKVRRQLHAFEFTLGGNWEYDKGCFDRYLDEAHKVWLRIPFEVTHGKLDGDTNSTDAVVRIGTPFVLNHIYNEGLDKEAPINTYGALMNQFQEPVDKDAAVDGKWVDQARKLLSRVEDSWR